jgi:trimethylamine:corrinoid methyltransferase-like protein
VPTSDSLDAGGQRFTGRLGYLTETDKTAIYEAALEIMQTVGARLHHPAALELLLSADAVRQVGPGGSFLSHRHTANVRDAQWRPTIINRESYLRWQEEGELDLRDKARRKALRLLEAHEPVPLPDDIAARVDELVAGFASDRT